MNYKQALNYGRNQLRFLENPSLEAEVILSRTTGRERTFLKAYDETKLGFFSWQKFKINIHKRKNHWPIGYIFGSVDWNGMAILVNKNTLIPRDETEILCHHIEKNLDPQPQNILDIGTGSGCLAIWAKKNIPSADVTALDISKKALKLAQKNADLHQVKINFIESDLLEACDKKTHYDLIIANLPYVPSGMKLSAEVNKEPSLALFSGTDGLDHIRAFLQQIKTKEISFQSCWLEFLPEQADVIKKLFSDYEVTLHQDAGNTTFFAEIKTF